MARPLKNNADYFSHDAGMRDDPKIKALRRKYKHTGFSIWCMFLELITDSDNFKLAIDYDIIAGDFDIEPDQLKEIMMYCVSLNLFQFDTDNLVLTCKTLENRFEGLLSKRKRDRSVVIAGDNPQSKVKESKVKENYITIGDRKIFDVTPILEIKEAALNARQKEHKLRSWKDLVPEWFRMNVQMDFNDEQHIFNAFSKYIINNGKPKQPTTTTDNSTIRISDQPRKVHA